MEECMAGFSFTDDKEAGQFYKKVENREKYAKSKGTKAPAQAVSLKSPTANSHTVVARENLPIVRPVSNYSIRTANAAAYKMDRCSLLRAGLLRAGLRKTWTMMRASHSCLIHYGQWKIFQRMLSRKIGHSFWSNIRMIKRKSRLRSRAMATQGLPRPSR